ncbi:MAG: carbohydrate deacetylase [Sedimentisphaerales bacterium]
MMPRKIIINADDFGLCRGVNDAVAEAHTTGVLTSATIMTNMAGVDEAIEMAKKMPALGVGVHLNVTLGKPLSADPVVKILTDADGNFRYSIAKLAIAAVVSKKIRQAIETELSAQISSLIGKGITPTHLDSHKHFHCLPTVWRLVWRLADKFSIPAIRWPYEPATLCGGDWPRVEMQDKVRALIVRQMALKCQDIDARFIKTDIFFGLAHTGRIDDKLWAELSQTQFAGIAEVMTHPGYPEGLGKTRLVEQRLTELKWLCAASTKKTLADAGIELISYRDIDKE